MKKIILLFIILVCLFSCDDRSPKLTLKLYSDTNIVYLNDCSAVISINSKYVSSQLFNKRVYFKTDNGYIRLNSNSTWTLPNKVIYVNTDKYGVCNIQYTQPTQAFISHVYAWTYMYNNDLTQINDTLIDSLMFHVLLR